MNNCLAKGEITRRIFGLPQYEISNLGNLYHRLKNGELKKLKLYKKNGYFAYHIGKRKKKHFYIHRLVAKAFLPAPMFPNMTVNHKNGIKPDNRACNLEWVTMQENILHGHYVLGKHIQPVMAINKDGRIVAVAASLRQLEVIGFNHSGVSYTLSGKCKTHNGCTFRRLSVAEYNNYVGQHFCIGHKIMYNYENV